MCDLETFEPIKGYDGYSINRKGQVKGTRGQLLKIQLRDYPMISIDYTKRGIHRLLATQFIENKNPSLFTQVNHKDGNKMNYSLSNLEWVSPSQNMKHAADTGLIKIHCRRVHQIDTKTNEILKTWESIEQARLALKIEKISSCAKGNVPTAGGYLWKYVDPPRKRCDPCLPNEIWKSIDWLEGKEHYSVSNLGRVKNTHSEYVLTAGKMNGYARVKGFVPSVHVLVATAFCERPAGTTMVNHKNRKRDDNRAENLEWVTASGNMMHASAKQVDQIDPKTGNIIKTWQSIEQAGQGVGTSSTNITSVCKNQGFSAGDFIWRYTGTYVPSGPIERPIPKVCKTVNQIDTKTNHIVKVWKSVKEAERSLSCSNIAACCRNVRGFDTCAGFKWSYESETHNKPETKKRKRQNTNAKSRKVDQIDPNSNIILKTWPSRLSASIALCLPNSTLHSACTTPGKILGGFKWKFTNDAD